MTWFIGLLLMAPGASLHTEPSEPRAQVLMMGVFHFANPRNDVVKSDQINVMTPASQAYLVGLAQRLAAFEPTVVLLEYDEANDAEIQERYADYRSGDFELPSNEVYQMGFRVAKLAGLGRVESFDEREVHWNAQPLFAHLEAHESPVKARFDGIISEFTQKTNRDHATKSLRQLLIGMNQPTLDSQNKALYLLTNDVGVADGTFVGADATASWWHRNFRMYARIQHHAGPGARVLVIGGQGHTAILRDFLADDPDRLAVDVLAYF